MRLRSTTSSSHRRRTLPSPPTRLLAWRRRLGRVRAGPNALDAIGGRGRVQAVRLLVLPRRVRSRLVCLGAYTRRDTFVNAGGDCSFAGYRRRAVTGPVQRFAGDGYRHRQGYPRVTNM